jgi:hypothetical protein
MGMGMRSHANGGYAHSHARSGSSSDATDHRNGGVRQTWLAKPDDKAAADEHEAPDDEAPMRMREFALVYATYMALLACRRNYGFWLPSVLSRLGKSKGEAGAVGSAFEMAYGACSLLNGVLIDSRSPRALLITGLVLTGIINVAVSVTDVLPAMAALWAVNGAVQSLGWPSVTNVFLAWFPDPAARGAWYSLLSTCQNAGAALVPASPGVPTRARSLAARVLLCLPDACVRAPTRSSWWSPQSTRSAGGRRCGRPRSLPSVWRSSSRSCSTARPPKHAQPPRGVRQAWCSQQTRSPRRSRGRRRRSRARLAGRCCSTARCG